jgi:hypothetical protein
MFRTGLLLALFALVLAAPARAQAPMLEAQIAQVTPTATPTPLAGEPPGLDGGEENGGGRDGDSGPGGNGDDSADPGSLAETGIDAGLVALMGLGLLGTGIGLRRLTVADDRFLV